MNFKVYEIPNGIKNAVYFLINDNEVVYVGKTSNGLKRIMQHNKKTFNKYSFFECDKEKLDFYEDYYIMEYQPKYNKRYNCYRISINSAYSKLSNIITNDMNIFEFARYIENNNIELKKFKGTSTIKKDDFNNIKKQLEKEYKIKK